MVIAPTPLNESERIASLRKMLLLSSPDEEAFDRVTRTAQRLFDVPIALLSLVDTNRQWFKSCVGLPVRETGRDISFCGHAIMKDELFVIEDAKLDPRFADNPLVTGAPYVIFYAGRPLRNAENHMVGTLCIIDHQPRHFSQQDRRALDDLGYWIEQIFFGRELSDAQRELLGELDEARRGSMLDPMLNIWNHDATIQVQERETLRAFSHKTPLAVMMIDLDHLGAINEQHGKAVGDAVLIEVAKRLRSSMRSFDTLGRFSGDKFIAILPDATVETAGNVAERIARLVGYPLVVGEALIECSVSMGIASADYLAVTPDPAEMLSWATDALYKAKLLGGGGVEASNGAVMGAP